MKCKGALKWGLEYIVLHVSYNTMLWKLSKSGVIPLLTSKSTPKTLNASRVVTLALINLKPIGVYDCSSHGVSQKVFVLM